MKLQDLIKEIKRRASVDPSPTLDSLLAWVKLRKSARAEYFVEYYKKNRTHIRRQQKTSPARRGTPRKRS